MPAKKGLGVIGLGAALGFALALHAAAGTDASVSRRIVNRTVSLLPLTSRTQALML